MITLRRGVWFGGVAQPVGDLLAVAGEREVGGSDMARLLLGILCQMTRRQRGELADGQFSELGKAVSASDKPGEGFSPTNWIISSVIRAPAAACSGNRRRAKKSKFTS